MLPPLCMREIRAVILVYCETQTAFEATDVVFEEVRVLVEIYRLQCEFAQTFTAIGVGGRGGRNASAAELRACSILKTSAYSRRQRYSREPEGGLT